MSHYFVLQSGSWAEADRHLCRPLIGTRKSRAPHTPWVAVARGTELNPAVLEEVAALVRSDSILERGWLMACPGRPGEMTKMHEIAAGVFGRAGALTQHVYFVEHGAMVGVSVADRTGGYLSLYGPEESEWLV